jgi:hypothetical protein
MSTTTNGRPQDKPWCPDCPECAGEGITSRYVTMPRRNGDEITASVGCYCHRCLAGRWVEQQHRERHPDLRARFLDLQDPRLRSLLPEELKYPPALRVAEDTYRRPQDRHADAAGTPQRTARRMASDLGRIPAAPNVAELPPVRREELTW